MNLILITIDCLRADHLSCLGYPSKTTPNLDTLASRGLLFTQAISVSPWTTPSFVALFTSSYPLMYGAQNRIANCRTTISQVLREHGYHTAAFHSNAFLSSYYGFDKGFDIFDDGMQRGDYEGERAYRRMMRRVGTVARRIIGANTKLYQVVAQARTSVFGHPCVDAEVLNRKALSWLSNGPSNFFLWLHYMDVHAPYVWRTTSTSVLERFRLCNIVSKAQRSPNSLSSRQVDKLIEVYDRDINYVDGCVGRLLRTVKERNILDNTLVIVTADHGEQFMEHGDIGHGKYLYEELIHVPLIITGPGVERQVVSQQVTLLDLAPTILDILSIEKPATFLGTSLLPVTMSKTNGGSEAIFSEQASVEGGFDSIRRKFDRNKKKISLRTGKWKYIYNEAGEDEFYDVEDDPKERTNLIDIVPDMAAELRSRIMGHIEFEENTMPTEEGLIKAKIRNLRASGKI